MGDTSMLGRRSLPAWVVCCSLVACSGSHSDLGQDTTSASGTGGAAQGGGGTGASSNVGGFPPVIEPDGPPKLTVVNAIVDRDALALCFLESPANAADAAQPWPEPNLPYSKSASTALPGEPVPPGKDVEIVALTGDLAAISNESCRTLADDPFAIAGLEVLSLGIAPASTFTAQRSLLLAVTGCFGGPGHDGEDLEIICGPGYTPDSPTPGVVFAPLSRIVAASAVGLQVVNATGAFESVDVYARASFDGAIEQLVTQIVVPGAAAPFPPSTAFSASEFGGPSSAGLRAQVTERVTAEQQVGLGTAMANGGLTAGDFTNGNNIVLVAVGPSPGAPATSWWNAFSFVAVLADP